MTYIDTIEIQVHGAYAVMDNTSPVALQRNQSVHPQVTVAVSARDMAPAGTIAVAAASAADRIHDVPVSGNVPVGTTSIAGILHKEQHAQEPAGAEPFHSFIQRGRS